MKKTTLTFMAVLFVTAIATTAFGFGRGPGYSPCGRGNPATSLNLTAEQKAKLKEMREAKQQALKPLREQMFAKRDAVRDLWLKADPDQKKIADAQKEMRSLRDQIQDEMTAYRLEELKILTPEQQEKLRSAAEECGFSPRRGAAPKGWGSGKF